MGRKKGKKRSSPPPERPPAGTAAPRGGWRGALPAAVLLLAAAAAYMNTLDAPFQWDEVPLILENPIIRDFDYFLEPSRAKGLLGYDSLVTRYLTNLTFAVNYHIHGTGVTGYHLANIALHVGTTLALYWLVLLILRTPALERTAIGGRAGGIAFASALLFSVHPLQTEAVTYVFQRFAVLAALLYIVSIALYIRWRLGGGAGWYATSIAAAVLAMLSKQNAFTLPLIIAASEFMFFPGEPKRRIRFLLPLFLTMLIIPCTQAAIQEGGLAGTVASQAKLTTAKATYLFTEFRVLVTYLRLFFFPVGQNLDYDYMEYSSLLSAPVLLSLGLLASLAAAGLWAFRRSRSGRPELVLVSWGIVWFFITLSVESSIIRIPMVINEYRMYLPSAGLMASIVPMGCVQLKDIRLPGGIPAGAAALAALALMFGLLSFERNALWRSEAALWGDVVSKSPGKTRGMLHLGVAYEKEGEFERSLKVYDRAVTLEPDNYEIHYDMGVSYWNLGQKEKAVGYYRKALELNPYNYDARNNIGVYYTETGREDLAIEEFRAAAAISPHKPRAHNNLGTLYLMRGEYENAARELLEVLRTAPPDSGTYNKLGFAYHQLGRTGEAKESYLAAIRLNPSDKFAQFNVGRLLLEHGETSAALGHLGQALRLDPENSDFRRAYEHARGLAEGQQD